MDFCRNVAVSGGLPSELESEQLFSSPCTKLGSLDDLFSGNSMEGDMNLEWLSIFVEDCLTSSGNCLPPQNFENSDNGGPVIPKAAAIPKPSQLVKPRRSNFSSCSSSSSSMLHRFVIPGKARSKRNRGPMGNRGRRITSWSQNLHAQTISQDPPLLQQAYWLADSELILPKEEEINKKSRGMMKVEDENIKEEVEGVNNVMMVKEEEKMGSLEGSNGQAGQQQQPRRCTHCLAQRTPQWRAGPLGPKTLCNACGVRYKSGRLLPEYRPAKSPTFVSYKHSNSHKKVLEMRTMSLLSSSHPSSY